MLMLEFLLAAMAAATVIVLLVPLLRRERRATPRLDHDLAIYRDQLAEIERERDAGALTTEETNAARLEIERRILVAASQAEPPAQTTPSMLDRMLPVALSLLIPLAALGLYLEIGHPGLPSAPFDPQRAAARQAPDQTITPAQMVAEARAHLAEHPDDPESLSMLGEALVIEADGTVGEPAVAAFVKALASRPNDARAIYYLGLHEAQSGDSRAALTRWLDLEARAAPDAPWLDMLRAEIARVAKAAGLDPQAIRPDRKPPAATPPAASGMPTPTQEQREAMANLTPEQRQQAIRSMVEGLEARLKESPQDRAGWLRLANAWRVLGESARAAEAYARADALGPLEPQGLSDWAETLVRQIAPGAAPSPDAIAVLTRLEKAQPNNALSLFYLGAASFAAGDKPAAVRRWKTLQALLPADAPIRTMLEEKIRDAEKK
jgi:cytochrome c-type biogenesis protein CcmH